MLETLPLSSAHFLLLLLRVSPDVGFLRVFEKHRASGDVDDGDDDDDFSLSIPHPCLNRSRLNR